MGGGARSDGPPSTRRCMRVSPTAHPFQGLGVALGHPDLGRMADEGIGIRQGWPAPDPPSANGAEALHADVQEPGGGQLCGICLG